jgi:mRNA interferase YafQ
VRRVVQRKQFRDDLKRQKRRGKDLRDLFEAVELLAAQATLQPACHAHRLRAEWSGYWECHIEADWLLIYMVTDDEVLLIRTGTHDNLFS